MDKETEVCPERMNLTYGPIASKRQRQFSSPWETEPEPGHWVILPPSGFGKKQDSASTRCMDLVWGQLLRGSDNPSFKKILNSTK